eukprot:COSAG06_NODE_37758_length_431_cov_1.189759_1_plen_38_part_10
MYILYVRYRLQTIAHCDLVAVLDQGECVEQVQKRHFCA